jgi:glucose/mannose transport system permease protein
MLASAACWRPTPTAGPGERGAYNQQMAAALLASFPTLLVSLLLGRFFMRGLMAGALKG